MFSIVRKIGRATRRRLKSISELNEPIQFGRVSYAQEGEDVLLWRILDGQHHPGTYVEVGCNHPFFCSNTGFFYLRGWRGIAIDPNPDFAEAFQKFRPEDLYVNCGVSRGAGQLDYFRFDESLFNTFSAEKAQEVRALGTCRQLAVEKIAVRRLVDILNEHWPGGRQIDLLSIDAEGMDESILLSHDFEKFPARFVIVESDHRRLVEIPGSSIDALMMERGYMAVAKLFTSLLYAKWNCLPPGKA